jgi:hypothetical protein
MKNSSMKSLSRACALATLFAGLAVASVADQQGQGAVVPRTAWGDPDLQGIWPSTHMVGVPFERPDEFGQRRLLTDAEFGARQKQAARQAELDTADFNIEAPSAEIIAMGDVGGPTSPPPHWLERGEPSRQSSLVVDPPNGRLPPMTPEGEARQRSVVSTYVKYTGFNSADEGRK